MSDFKFSLAIGLLSESNGLESIDSLTGAIDKSFDFDNDVLVIHVFVNDICDMSLTPLEFRNTIDVYASQDTKRIFNLNKYEIVLYRILCQKKYFGIDAIRLENWEMSSRN